MPCVYILSNSELPGIVKIGKSRFDSTKRAGQLSRYTGVLGELNVDWSKEVADADIAERLLHFAFRKCRVQKEFFAVESHIAQQLAEEVLEGIELIDKNIDSKLGDYFDNGIPDRINALEICFKYLKEEEHDKIRNLIHELKQIQKRILKSDNSSI